jgi:hypothetical protein
MIMPTSSANANSNKALAYAEEYCVVTENAGLMVWKDTGNGKY